MIAYLIERHGRTLKDALAQVSAARSVAKPNKGFMLALEEFEVSRRGASIGGQPLAAGPRLGSRVSNWS